MAGIAAGAVAFAASAHAAVEDGGVGSVNDIVNVAWGTPPGDARDEVEFEDAVFMQEIVETDDESAMVIVFADGSKLTMGENAKVVIDHYVYDATGGTGSAAMKLTRGAFRFVSGAIPKESVKIETPTITIGIRGTELMFDIADDGETEMSTLSGEADCTDGGGETLTVLANESVVAGRDRRFRGKVRRFLHKSRSIAIAEGLDGARKRWRVRKERKRRAIRRMRRRDRRN